jgi:hypothetical protein
MIEDIGSMKDTTKLLYKDLVKGQKVKYRSTWDSTIYDHYEILDIDRQKHIVVVKTLFTTEDKSTIGNVYKLDSFYFDEASNVTPL